MSIELDLATLEITDDEWENYKRKFEKQYNANEDIQRRKMYEESKRVIVEHNRKYKDGEVAFSMAINQFADRTPEETCGCMKRRPEN